MRPTKKPTDKTILNSRSAFAQIGKRGKKEKNMKRERERERDTDFLTSLFRFTPQMISGVSWRNAMYPQRSLTHANKMVKHMAPQNM